MDIGGGVGIIQKELFREGISKAIQVDASRAYLEVSEEEAQSSGYGDQVSYHYGDFVDMASDLPDSDIVALDRVICCYPDMPALVNASAAKSTYWYGAVYPVDRWYTRWGSKLVNLYFKLTGSDFRTYIHPESEIDRHIRNAGFKLHKHTRTMLWNVSVYKREKSSE